MPNRFDERYDIRFAEYEEIPEVMRFIDTYWKKGHILAKNRVFFEYEMVIDGVVNFIIAKSKTTNQIEGIHGFLPCSKNTKRFDIWGVVWKTIPEAMPMLGMELKKRTILITGARTELGVGANPETSVLLLSRICHYYTSRMKHYYRLADKESYKIPIVNDKEMPSIDNAKTIKYMHLQTINELEDFFDFDTVENCIPFKDKWYYERRFFNHPLHKYKLWGLEEGDRRAVLVTRKQECNGENVIRIVDYLGDHSVFSGAGSFLESLLDSSEYVDFYFDGFEEYYAKSAGMKKVEDTDTNIIPDYFSPFVQRNVDIYVDSSDTINTCYFFKADGDQDRPN